MSFWRLKLVEINPKYFRPTEVNLLLGNPAKAKEKLGWSAEITFPELVQEMVKADIDKVKAGDFIN